MKLHIKKRLIIATVLLLVISLMTSIIILNTRKNMAIRSAETAAKVIKIEKVFELHKDKFDILRSGQLMALNEGISSGSIDESGNFRHYEGSEFIEELPSKEKDAIIFLLSSKDLDISFVAINCFDGTMGVIISDETQILAIRYKDWWPPYPAKNPRVLKYLQDDYCIWGCDPPPRG